MVISKTEQVAVECPFCGTVPDIVHEFPYRWNKTVDSWIIGCSNPACGIEMQCEGLPEDAICKWNTRYRRP